MALQFSTGKVSLTESQQLAADVDLSGTVDATDGMKINQYAVSTILSFYASKMIEIPLETESSITSGNYYRIQNTATSRYISFDSNNNSVKTIASSAYDSTSTDCKFKLQKASENYPIYTITRSGSSGFLALDADRNLTFNTTGRLSGSQFWYIFPYGTGYLIVNQKEIQQPLRTLSGDDLGIAALHANQVWLLHGAQITIKYYYDYAYAVREGSNSNATAELSKHQNTIRQILSTVFGANVTIESTITKTRSYGDDCYDSTSSITLSTINAECTTCNGCNDTTCVEYSYGTELTSGNCHHRRDEAILYDLYKNKQINTDGKTIRLLTSGYRPCGEDMTAGEHTVGSRGGMAVGGHRVCVVFSTTNRDYSNTISALHEIGHCLGVSGSQVDDNHGNCVMSYNETQSVMTDRWNQEQFGSIFCVACTNSIIENLKYY